MKEYAFDAKVWATVRVTARSEKAARAKMVEVLGQFEVNLDQDGVRVTCACIEDGDDSSQLLEIDGEAV